jgi:glyoxylase-like metal-dependent hydrolase (beta-lactamase superfamily II)
MRVSDDVRQLIRFSARYCLRALRHQVELLVRETEIVPGVRAIPAPGHTPGHLALLLDSEGCQLLNLGDAATHPLHLRNMDWQNGFDLDPCSALAIRRSLLERAEAEQMRVMAFHFPFPSVGHLSARCQTGWDWAPGW